MSISIRMTEREKQIVKEYSKLNGLSVSEVMRQAIFEKIEDEYDVLIIEEAVNEYEKEPKSYSLEEVKKILDI
ncbi:MAG: type II toxin-antitoxin system RelB family antitoxin [Acholeplasmatales bacterium]